MCYWKKVLLLGIALMNFHSLWCTHIVGGVIYYERISGNRFKLIFEIYKDCSPNVKIGFDGSCNPDTDPIGCKLPFFYYSIFEGTSTSNRDYNGNNKNGLLLKSSENIRPVIVNPCLPVNSNTCVVKGIYETEVTLDPSKGYTIQYQRCCRNDGILNIQNQPGTGDKPGITLRTYIPPHGSISNNSARFKSFPPIFICKDQQFYFDHSATDGDGDQLRYSLATPLQGLSTNQPYSEAQSLSAPPINWTSPYSLNNVLGGNPTMSIDSVSGLLNCKPPTAGRFVVSVQVKEIRNGVVIDSFARDFQYNVIQCDIPYADAPFLPGTYNPIMDTGVFVQCGELSQTFQNYSTNATRYEWKFGDPASGANNTSTATTPTHVFSAPGRYVVTLLAYKNNSNGQLCMDSTQRICYIYPKPTADFSFSPSIACQGTSIQFSDKSATNSGTIKSWDWDFGTGQKSNVQNPLNPFINAGTFPVTLKITSSNSCRADTSFKVVIYPKPFINTSLLKACITQPLLLQCSVTVPSPSVVNQYRWTLPDGTQYNTCNASYTALTPTSGTINFWAMTDKGCRDSQDYAFSVFPLPVINATEDTTLCYDQNLTLNVTGGVSYIWSPSQYLSNSTIPNPIASPPYPDSFTYSVKGTDANGCFNFDSTKIKFFKKGFINAGLDTSICLNASSALFKDFVQLNGAGNFLSARWAPVTGLSNPNILNPIAKPTINTSYVLYGTDSNNCILKDTVLVVVLNPAFNLILQDEAFMCVGSPIRITPIDQGQISSYTWSPTTGIDSPNLRAPLFSPLDTTLYILTVSNYCYTKKDSILINASQLPDPGLPKSAAICLGDVYQFRANPNMRSYLWITSDLTFSNKAIYNPTASPSASRAYILSVVDQYGCTNRDTQVLEVFYPPSLQVLGIPRYICQGIDSAKLTAITDQPSTFLWRNRQTLTSDTGRDVQAFPWDTTVYFVTATSQTYHQCSTTTSFVINVQKPIYPYIDHPNRLCKGKYLTMRAYGGLYYRWTPAQYINDTLTDTPQVYPDKFFTYKVYISNDCFLDSILTDVYVDTLPIVIATEDTTIYRGTEAILTANSNVNNYLWTPKEEINTNPFTSTIRVSPVDTTLYRVYVTNDQGCTGYDSVYVYVEGKNVLLLPTGFSPNGDGINDVFKIVKHLNIKNIRRFEVFNRWGQMVFSTSDINKGWDGTYEDSPSPAGVYIWKVEAISMDNERLTRSGNITLIR